jgi:hypothetical protein
MGGIAINAGFTAAERFGIAAITAYEAANVSQYTPMAGVTGPWRPPQWSETALYMIAVPPGYTQTSAQVVDGNGSQIAAPVSTANAPTYLVFDAVIHASHSQQATPTQYPVQNQSNYSDHIVLHPPRLSLDIVMSDAVQAYAAGQWLGNASKSISCFQTLSALRAARVPLTIYTRLATYTNMALIDVVPDENVRTLHGLRARVEFQGVFIATVQVTQQNGTSARQQTTDATQLGPVNPTPVPSGVVAQNGLPSSSTGVPSSSELQSQDGAVIGAGNWSSNNTGILAGSY